MSVILVPTTGPDDWQRFLADPEKQWKSGYSAQELAKCWELANGLPTEVSRLFGTHFAQTELLLAIPEYRVRLPGGGRDSQKDLFCLPLSTSVFLSHS